MGEHSRRLDSWKEIAEYLGRDVRTAMRWARAHGLPVRRVAGGKGRSVFAFTDEVDEWLAGESAALPSSPTTSPTETPTGQAQSTVAEVARGWSRMAALSAIAIVLIAGIAMTLSAPERTDTGSLRLSTSPERVTIVDASGVERVVHAFDPAVLTRLAITPPSIVDVDADGQPDVMVGVSYYEDLARKTVRSGELMQFAPDGSVRWRFAFDDKLPFRETTFTGPWAITDWQVGPAASPSRVAVAAHHGVWWASIAAILDHRGHRLTTFVNPGWLESLLWVDGDRLAVAGFNNARNEAMFAIVDSRRTLGQAPGTEGTPFHCETCPSEAPLFYATFPRSELNVLTASRFNRAQLSRVDDRILVTTIEIPGAAMAATAIYEFDRSYRLLRARYDEAYWDAHRRLEIEGRITHSRRACPDREGPPAFHLWSGSNWKRVPTGR